MHYKRGKPKEKKGIEWSTPRSVQQKVQKPIHSIPGKQKYHCKKSKGEHTFQFIENLTFFDTSIEKYRCTMCGKEMLKKKE